MCVSLTAEAVVAESVVVIKKLLQMQPKENKDLIAQVARLADRVQVTSLPTFSLSFFLSLSLSLSLFIVQKLSVLVAIMSWI